MGALGGVGAFLSLTGIAFFRQGMAIAVAGYAIDAGLFRHVFLAMLNVLVAPEAFDLVRVYMNGMDESRIIDLPPGC
jgi:hypothetical protein